MAARRRHSAPFDYQESTQGQLGFSSAIVRLDRARPALLTDAEHVALDVTAFTVVPGTRTRAGYLVIGIDTPVTEKIATCLVDEDETLSGMRVTAGCSAGVDQLVIRLYQDGVPISPTSPVFAKSVGANLWVLFGGFTPTMTFTGGAATAGS